MLNQTAIVLAIGLVAVLIVPWAALQRSHAQSDLTDAILKIHNDERAAVGVPPLKWSDSLAAGAKTWAEHDEKTGHFNDVITIWDQMGQNSAGFFKGISAPGEGQSKWVDEKMNWNGSTCHPLKVCSHYLNMINSRYTEVGCGTAPPSGLQYSVLVCRYR